jgi:hypothetical protein
MVKVNEINKEVPYATNGLGVHHNMLAIAVIAAG